MENSANLFGGFVPRGYKPTAKRSKKAITMDDISADERALAEMIAPASDNFLLHNPRSTARKDELLALMRERFPGEDPEKKLKAARKARAKLLAANPNKAPKPVYSPEEAQLRDWHRSHPNYMVKPEYQQLLMGADMRGVDTSASVKHQEWLGKTPQRVGKDEYNDMAQDFAEMVGVMQMRPQYDRRF